MTLKNPKNPGNYGVVFSKGQPFSEEWQQQLLSGYWDGEKWEIAGDVEGFLMTWWCHVAEPRNDHIGGADKKVDK